jgi:RNA polymerase sigma factor (sigma-70 family)
MEQSKILEALGRLQGGDEAAFDELWRCFQATIKHVVFSFRDGRLNFTEADLRQEARYLLFVLAKKHDLSKPFQASYLHCHLTSRFKDLLRGRETKERCETRYAHQHYEGFSYDGDIGEDEFARLVPLDTNHPERICQDRERRTKIAAIFTCFSSSLPALQRKVLEAHLELWASRTGPSNASREIAEQFGCTEGTVKVTLTRVRNKLRRQYPELRELL